MSREEIWVRAYVGAMSELAVPSVLAKAASAALAQFDKRFDDLNKSQSAPSTPSEVNMALRSRFGIHGLGDKAKLITLLVALSTWAAERTPTGMEAAVGHEVTYNFLQWSNSQPRSMG